MGSWGDICTWVLSRMAARTQDGDSTVLSAGAEGRHTEEAQSSELRGEGFGECVG